MEKSTVYFTDFRCPVGTSQLDKLKKLCIAAGIKDIDMEGKFIAIKMHFGELGNMAFLRPNYAKVVADLCKEQGGLPFLTDCNTLYPGSRKNALEHLDCANLNGFNTITTGCQIIIGDGVRGTDEIEVPVVNGEYCKTALIGHAIMDADIFISLSHFKGHEATGFGGALKNIGMGCGSRAGKMQQHASGKPAINTEVCRGCHRCAKECGSDPGTTASIPVQIAYGAGTVNAGVTVRVVSSTRPLTRVGNKTLKIKAGASDAVNVLTGAYNPFPDSSLTVISCKADDAAKLTIAGCDASGNITIAVASDVGASTNTVLVTVQDGTKSKDREVTASITVSVIDKPEPPLL